MNIYILILEVIEKIFQKEIPTDTAISEYLEKFEMTLEDQLLFTKTIEGVISNMILLEYYLTPYIPKRRQKQWVRSILYLSIYRFLYLDETQNQCLEDALEWAKLKDRSIISLIDKLLEGFFKNPLRSTDILDDMNRLSISNSIPLWLVAFLLKDYTVLELEELFKIKKDELYNLYLIDLNLITKEEMIIYLKDNNYKYKFINDILLINGKISKELENNLITFSSFNEYFVLSFLKENKFNDCLIVFPNSLKGLNYYLENYYTDQSYTIVELNNQSKRTIKDLSKSNLEKVNIVLFEDLDLNNIYDCVIINSLNSGLGKLSEIVDLKYHLTYDSLETNALIQAEFLSEFSNLVNKGGYLIYCTDTINKDENENQVREFLKHNRQFTLEVEKLVLINEYQTNGCYYAIMRKDK